MTKAAESAERPASGVNPSDTSPEEILKKYWGYDQFRPLQADIVRSVLHQSDTVALLPTGGGKSLCYQVPALLKEGLCIVISPLISLMEDQVNALKNKGIKAIAINSFMTSRDIDHSLDNAIYGNLKLLYISPERIHTEIFKERFKKMNVSFLAVDEAHCISQWGHEFRPAYLQIHVLKELKPDLKTIALTATATTKVVGDIRSFLRLKDPTIFTQSFERKNISFRVVKAENKVGHLLRIIRDNDGSGIVYARNRRKCKELSEMLNFKSIPSSYYHAGLDHEERLKRQVKWTNSKRDIMVATNAFGMGIDKSNVRFVIHWDLPDSPEAFYQEAGRAGRDQFEAASVVLCNDNDVKKLWQSYYSSYPKLEVIKQVYQHLCNYFRVAIGDFPEDPMIFEFNSFCEQSKLAKSTAWYALKVLENEGYINLSENFYQPSQIHICALKEDLRKFEREHRNYSELLQFLLRAYSGILDQAVQVDEKEIALKTGLNIEKVKHHFLYLEKLNLLKYKSRNSSPVLTFITSRPKDTDVQLSDGFRQRKNAHFERISTMINFVQNSDKCRQVVILEYFGEKNRKNCGKCDVCLHLQKSILKNDLPLFTKTLTAFLEEKKEMNVAEVIQLFPQYNEESILSACRQLIEMEVIKVNGNLKFSLKN